MFQLRFLIASPRKMSPHIFCHRDYRGQRTKPDDFHPQFNTYVCQPKGTQTSYDVMLELMQSAAAHQSAQQLFSVVELFNPQTHERLKLKGDEIILRPSDLAAAQEAFNATQPAAPEPIGLAPVNDVNPVNDVPLLTQYEALPEGGRLNIYGILGKGIPDAIQKQIGAVQTQHPEAIFQKTTEKITLCKPIPQGVTLEFKAEPTPATSETENAPLTVLDRVRTEIQTNGKATATQLANTLGISAGAIKDAVASEGSGLQNKGGWISPIPTEN